MAPASTPNSAIVWRGPSAFTGRDVEVLVQCLKTPSTNEKTGRMVQVSIVQADENPSLMRGTDRERDVCGDCRGQKRLEGWCYEDWQPFLIGQRRHLAERVRLADAGELLRGRAVRVGAYGDPAAVPFEVWARLLAHVSGWTGYTHAWRTCDSRFRLYLMASVESHVEAAEAASWGWRTFRIRPNLADQPAPGLEVLCPFESRAVTCERCRLCAGTGRPAKSIVITVHGPRSRKFSEAA
jgi:hypothetical protein